MPEMLTSAFEYLVGVFMLLLGAFGMVRACRKRPKDTAPVDELPLTALDDNASEGQGESNMSVTNVGQPISMSASVSSAARSEPAEMEQTENQSSRLGDFVRTACARCIQSLSTKTLACIIGILHGVAGPGGVLGVIPAVQLKNWKYSTIYLGSFCISSTLIMGCYAALYGTCSQKLGKERGKRWEFLMECFSSTLSIIVGLLWLTLLACGKMDDVFP